MKTFVKYTTQILLTVLLASCSVEKNDGDDSTSGLHPWDEAYEVGYSMGFLDKCSVNPRRINFVPTAYDDSMEEGELGSAFQMGYYTAAEKEPCRYSEGRSLR